ncbi:MoaD/ThiS family protein [Nocardia sp. NPDC051030]|uniref:MoaD/ThiS family protein n=1 Tax=Nocardia sp. NPDC051030 TaxID=3155162 RepID=UPI00343E0E4E
MTATVDIPTIFRSATNGRKTLQAEGRTVREIIESIEVSASGIRDRLVTGGELRRFVNVYVDDDDVRFLSGLDTVVANGSRITILQAVAGG